MMRSAFCLILLAFIGGSAVAQNVDLSTLPPRDSVQLTIYNAEDLTLVCETRAVTFKEGNNPLQFSWANTLIDPTSVRLRFLDHVDQLNVLETTFHHDKPQMLYWNVSSEISGQARIEVTYFTSGITWSADYRLVLSPDEQTAELTGYVTVTNSSGEDYEDAQIRLVVGDIHLVEKIVALASRGLTKLDAYQARQSVQNKEAVVPYEELLTYPVDWPKITVDRLRQIATEGEEGERRRPAERQKEVFKKGLSEYHVFRIEGRETIANHWSKRLQYVSTDEAEVRTVYRYWPLTYQRELVRCLLIANSDASGLGQAAMPAGRVDVYQRHGNEAADVVVLASVTTPYVATADDLELNVGPDPRVTLDTTALWIFRNRIYGQLDTLEILRRHRETGRVDVNVPPRVVGWDRHTIHRERIVNRGDRPAKVEIRRPVLGDVELVADFPVQRYDRLTAEYEMEVPAGEEVARTFEVIRKLKTNFKQEGLDIRRGKVVTPPWLRN